MWRDRWVILNVSQFQITFQEGNIYNSAPQNVPTCTALGNTTPLSPKVNLDHKRFILPHVGLHINGSIHIVCSPVYLASFTSLYVIGFIPFFFFAV